MFAPPMLHRSCLLLPSKVRRKRSRTPSARARAIPRLEDLQIVQPGTGIELGVDGVDEELLRRLPAIPDGLEDNNTGHLLLHRGCRTGARVRHRRAPAESDGFAVMPDIEELEGDIGLATLAHLEIGTGVKGRAAQGYGTTRAAAVDELDDAVGVVMDGSGEDGVLWRRVARLVSAQNQAQ